MTSAIKSTEESVSELEKGVTAAFGTPGSNDQKHFICFFSLMEDFKRKLEKWESVHCSSYGPRWFLHPEQSGPPFMNPARMRSGTKGR